MGNDLNVWTIAERFGFPIACLVIVALFIWKGLWPTIGKLNILMAEMSEKAQDRLDAASERAQKRLDDAATENRRSSELRDSRFEQMANKIADRLDELGNRIDRRWDK